MPSKRNPKTVLLKIDGHDVKVVLRRERYELYVDDVLVDEGKGLGDAIPFIQRTRLTAKPQSGTYIEANIRHMGIALRLEVLGNGKMLHSQFFF